MSETNYGYRENETNPLAEPASNVAQKAKDAISETGKRVMNKTEELSRSAVSKIEENRVSAAGSRSIFPPADMNVRHVEPLNFGISPSKHLAPRNIGRTLDSYCRRRHGKDQMRAIPSS